MTTMADAFLADVLAHPAEDWPRLIYADWLEDHGQEEHAEFVRVQCRIGAIERKVESDEDCGNPRCPYCSELRPLRQREKELRQVAINEWARVVGSEIDRWFVEPRHPRTRDPIPPSHQKVTFRRGFAAVVRCDLAFWLTNGPALVRQAPMERVEILDKRPLRHDRTGRASGARERIFFHAGGMYEQPHGSYPWALPQALFNLLPAREGLPAPVWVYDDFASATEALSTACLAFAKGTP